MTPGLRLRSLALRLAGRARALEHVPILGDIRLPLRRRVFLRENRGDGALRLAGAAIDAFVRVDIQLILTLVDAVHGADIHARPILQIDAGLCDDVRHSGSRQSRVARAPPHSRRIANIVRGPTPVQGLVAGTAIRVMSDRMPTRNAYWTSAVSSGSSAARPKPSVAAAATPSSTSNPSEVANHITAMTATAIQRCRRVSARKPRAPSSCHSGSRLKRLTQAPKCAMAPHTSTLVTR